MAERTLQQLKMKVADNGRYALAERIVRDTGISSRNWEMFRRREGSYDGRRWSQKEIAAAFGVSEPRVSQILASVERCLADCGSGPSDPERLRGYRHGRCRSLAEHPVGNASTVREVVESVFALKWDPPYDYATMRRKKMCGILLRGSFRFVADGRYWEPVGFCRKHFKSEHGRDPGSDEYAIINWMREADGPVHSGLCDLKRSSPLVFDCGGRFYVWAESRLSRTGEYVISLKPAALQ